MATCCGKECEYNYVCEDGGIGECRGMDDIIDRLAAIEDILGDEYNLDVLREIVNNNSWMSPVCIGCPGKDKDWRRTEQCKYPDDQTLCEERQKRLFELAEADQLIGKELWLTQWWTTNAQLVNAPIRRTVVYFSVCKNKSILLHFKDGTLPLRLIGDCAYRTREAAEAAIKGDTNG